MQIKFAAIGKTWVNADRLFFSVRKAIREHRLNTFFLPMTRDIA
jgi:hypothetical protein